jgi:peptidyl-tRNA hydrolase, PTH2 family
MSDDPIVMYLIVRKSLNMGVGKIAAQCGHAVQLLLESKPESETFTIWNDKDNGGMRKIVLSASDNEWEKLKEKYNPFIVLDAGITEVAAGSETVMALLPMYRSQRCNVLKRLRCL